MGGGDSASSNKGVNGVIGSAIWRERDEVTKFILGFSLQDSSKTQNNQSFYVHERFFLFFEGGCVRENFDEDREKD